MFKHTRKKWKSAVSCLTMFMLVVATGAMVQSALAQQKKLIAIIVPSPENPFFKAEADAADAKAKAIDSKNQQNGLRPRPCQLHED